MKIENAKEGDINSSVIMYAMYIFGNSARWPYVLMHEYEVEISIWQFYDKFKRLPSLEELQSEETKKLYNSLLAKLRSHLENLLNDLTQRERLAEIGKRIEEDKKKRKQQWEEKEREKARVLKVGKDFIEGNKVDYGGKTVAQLAEELGISKSEVRRRKQANLL